MLIHEIAGPSGSTSALAIQVPDASRMPKARPSPSISRQSSAIWFQPASTDRGATPSASPGSRRSICNSAALLALPLIKLIPSPEGKSLREKACRPFGKRCADSSPPLGRGRGGGTSMAISAPSRCRSPQEREDAREKAAAFVPSRVTPRDPLTRTGGLAGVPPAGCGAGPARVANPRTGHRGPRSGSACRGSPCRGASQSAVQSIMRSSGTRGARAPPPCARHC